MFECVQICSVSDTFHAIQHPAQSRSPRAVSGIECRPVQRVQRPGACRALRGLPWYLPRSGSGTACATACAVQSFRVRWSGQGCTGRVYSRRPAPPGQPFNHRKNKKDPPHLHKSEPIRLCKSPKIPKNTKRPISEPRLCYNQLKAIRQRKEESK